MGDHEEIYPIAALLKRSLALSATEGFRSFKSADLIFGCIAKIEDAWVITLDRNFQAISDQVKIIELNESRSEPHYRCHFPMIGD